MSDYLLELSQNPRARQVVKTLGLPIPMPQTLKRAKSAWVERPLHNRDILVSLPSGASLGSVVAETLAKAGANPWVLATPEALSAFEEPGEAYARPAKLADAAAAESGLRPSAILLDASGLESPGDLRALFETFQPWLRSMKRSGRIVVCARPADETKRPEVAATRAALEGFIRSLAKEVGRGGSSAQLLLVSKGAEERVEPVLRFLLSDRSAFVTGQVWRVTKSAKKVPQARYQRPLEGKVALVTGAARGIGAETARRLSAEGARVVVLDRPADDGPASRVAREIDGVPLLVDITDEDAPERIATMLKETFGGVDIVVHNAGITRDKMLRNMNEERWDMAVDVNLGAVIRINARLCKDILRAQGRVICLSSIAGLAGNAGQTNYSASKSGIAGYVAALAPTLAARGITSNAVAPGFIETRLTDAIPPLIREAGRRMNSLSQGGLPLDIAEVVTFLASPGASGVTGEVLRVCGGHLVGR